MQKIKQHGPVERDAPTLDTVKSFSEYAHIGITLVYQYTRAQGFPVIQIKKRGKKLIDREAAVEWMKRVALEPPNA